MPKKRGRSTITEDSGQLGRLVKITTYIPQVDRLAVEELTKDGSKLAEHYRTAIREYVLREQKKRR